MALQSHSKHWVQKPPEAGVRPQGSVSPNRPGPPHSSWLLLPLPWGISGPHRACCLELDQQSRHANGIDACKPAWREDG